MNGPVRAMKSGRRLLFGRAGLPRLTAGVLPAALLLAPALASGQLVTPGDPGAPPLAPVAPASTVTTSTPATGTPATGTSTTTTTATTTGTSAGSAGSAGAAAEALPSYPQPSPIGLWRTIDDKTGKARSLVRISDPGDGVLVGRIERFLEHVPAGAVCEKCEDDRYKQPVLGLEIIRGLKFLDGRWADGRILNPEDGRIYHLNATPIDGGEKLKMRGYIGMPLFGRTQVWIREP